MTKLSIDIPDSLWATLQHHHQTTGMPPSEVVLLALSQYLQGYSLHQRLTALEQAPQLTPSYLEGHVEEHVATHVSRIMGYVEQTSDQLMLMVTERLRNVAVEQTGLSERVTAVESYLVKQHQDRGLRTEVKEIHQAIAVLTHQLKILQAPSLTATALAQRLGIDRSTLRKHRDRPDFSLWSQTKDPEGHAWTYQANRFVQI